MLLESNPDADGTHPLKRKVITRFAYIIIVAFAIAVSGIYYFAYYA